MKRIKLYFTVFMTICLCSACGKPQETTEDPSHKTIGSDNWKQTGETSESVETVSIQIPETYERTEENVYFKADIICPDEIRKGSVKIPKISLQLINEEKIIDEIYKNISIGKDEVKEYPGDDGEVLKVRYLTGPEIQSLSVYSFGADYTTAFYRDYIGHSFDLEEERGIILRKLNYPL